MTLSIYVQAEHLKYDLIYVEVQINSAEFALS